MHSLVDLSLIQNTLTGSIPSEIGLMKNLRTLNLSQNSLSSRVPDTVANLLLMERLLLFDNENLSGNFPMASSLCQRRDYNGGWLNFFWADCKSLGCKCCTKVSRPNNFI